MSFKETHPAKWLILPLCIISCFGIEFAFDNPGVLKELLTQSFKSKYNPEQFEIYYSLLYSCLALPNIIVPFIIGYLIDMVPYFLSLITLFLAKCEESIHTAYDTLCYRSNFGLFRSGLSFIMDHIYRKNDFWYSMWLYHYCTGNIPQSIFFPRSHVTYCGNFSSPYFVHLKGRNIFLG